MEQTRTADAAADSGAAVVATVNGTRLVNLWGPDGIPIAVEEQYVAAKMAQGYALLPAVEPDGLIGELRLKFDAAARAIEAFWDGVSSDGYVDTSDNAQKAAAERAMDEVVLCWGDFHRAVQLKYPTRAGNEEKPMVYRYEDERGRKQEFNYSPQQVAMQRPDGQLFAVPRTDVAMFEGMGYTVAQKGRDVDRATREQRKADGVSPDESGGAESPEEDSSDR
jgi:hypothetical protein